MLWNIRHWGAEEDPSQCTNSFLDKIWVSPGFQLLQKGQKVARNKKIISGLWFSCACAFVSCLNLQRIYLVIHKESSKWWICKSVPSSVFVSFAPPLSPRVSPVPQGSGLGYFGAGMGGQWWEEGWGAPHTQPDQNLPSNLLFSIFSQIPTRVRWSFNRSPCRRPKYTKTSRNL